MKRWIKVYRRVTVINWIFLCGFCLVLSIVVFLLLQRSENKVREKAGMMMRSTVQLTHETIKSTWLDQQWELTKRWASDSTLVGYTRALVSLPANRNELLNSEIQSKVLNYIKEKTDQRDIIDVTLISRDLINLTSFLEQRVGDTSLIVKLYRKRLEKVLLGYDMMIPPISSEVPLPNEYGELIMGFPCIFICSPVKDFSGKVIAALAIRYDPRHELALIARMGFSGSSGEIYMVDSLGRMVSESRFTNELVARGLIHEGERTLLNLEVREMKKGKAGSATAPFTFSTNEVIQKKTGYNISGYRDYMGTVVLGAWMWDEEMGIGFISEIDEAEALGSYEDTFEIAIGLTGVTIVLGFILFFGWRKVTRDFEQKMEERRKTMEQFLKKDRERLQTILNSSPVGVALSVGDKIISCNRQYSEMFGLKAGDDWLKICPNPDVRKRLGELVERNELADVDVQLIDAQGNPMDALITCYKEDSDGNPNIVSWVIDITRQKQSARQLQLLNEIVYGGLESANIGAWWIDFTENDTFHALDKTVELIGIPVNPDGTKTYETSRWSEITATSAVKHPRFIKEVESVGEKFTGAIVGKYNDVDVTYPVTRPDGSMKWINVRSYVPHRDEKGLAGLMVGIIIDVSEQKKAELEVVEAKEEAVQATKSKSEFLARMSHEIRTPMNAIIGITHLVMQSELTQKQRDNLRKVHESGLSLLEIINDILDFSKIEAGKLELDHVEFDLEATFNELANVVTYKAHEKNLEVVFDLQQSLPPLLIGDPLRLKQVLINLVNNAIKFTPEGEIVVKARTSKIEDDRICILFSVKDTGIGLSKEEIGRLFQSFSQADSSTTRKYGGTGLGLSICKNLVEMFGGEIWIDSEKGDGSTFYFTSWFDVNKDQEPRELTPPIDLRGMKVLVCDDNETAADVIKEVLEGFTFKVKVVNSGADAIAELEDNTKSPYQLLFMDWNMPSMDGLKTIEAIKSNGNINPSPLIIMLTAYNRQDVLMAAEKAGVNSFLVKPVGYSMLFDTIMMLFDREDSRLPSPQPMRITNEILAKLEGALVLLVEDNEVNQDVATGMLEECGVKAEIANNGKEAIDMVKASGVPSKYKAVLMDLRMPVMDGYESTQEIRKMELYKTLPIIAMTADAISGIKERCLEVGMNDFINKPIDPDQFYNTLAKWINSSSGKPAVTPDVKNKIEIDDIPGVNKKARMTRFRTDAAYLKFLRNFEKHFSEFLPVLEATLFAGDLEKSERMVHDLKGLSGMLDSQNLHAFAITLDDKLKRQQKVDIEAELTMLAELLEPILTSIRAIVERNDIDNGPRPDRANEGPLDTKSALLILDDLRTLLKQNDFEVINRAKSLDDVDGIGVFKREVEQIIIVISNYDFDEALIMVERLIRRIVNN